jgi:hypothetical protein
MVRRRVRVGDLFADGHFDFEHLVGLHQIRTFNHRHMFFWLPISLLNNQPSRQTLPAVVPIAKVYMTLPLFSSFHPEFVATVFPSS